MISSRPLFPGKLFPGQLQAKHVRVDALLAALYTEQIEEDGPVALWPFAARHGMPERLLLAKLRRLIKVGLVEGCACGCRGDFVLTDWGRVRIGALSVRCIRGQRALHSRARRER